VCRIITWYRLDKKANSKGLPKCCKISGRVEIKYLWLMTKMLLIYCSTICVGKPDLLHLHLCRLAQLLLWKGGRWQAFLLRSAACSTVHCHFIMSGVSWSSWWCCEDECWFRNGGSVPQLFAHSIHSPETRICCLRNKRKRVRKIHFITFRLLYFLLFSFFIPLPQVIFVARLLEPSCIWRDNDDYGDRVGDAEGVKWCHMF